MHLTIAANKEQILLTNNLSAVTQPLFSRAIVALVVCCGILVISPQAMANAVGSSESCTPPDDAERRIYWGDLHTHTALSMDAYVLNTTKTPEDAYRFAKGGASILQDGSEHRLARPLDFAAVTDHAEYFGLTQVCIDEPERPYCKGLAEAAKENSPRGFMEMFLPLLTSGERNCLVDDQACAVAESSLWQREIDAANAANDPCKFTAFVANEWTASPGNLHWHRNLIYATDKVPERAINALDQPTQEQLWQALDAQCRESAGCEVLAIPHNSNIGMGGAFQTSGHSAATHALRARFEKLVEIHQHKGSSECYAQSNFSDEACDFEFTIPIPLRNALVEEPRELTDSEHSQIASGYVRDALANGLQLRDRSGVNPFRYGFVGATDSHSARPGDVEEERWSGAIGQWDATIEGRSRFATYNPGGITGIWAEQNTRASLFAALKRREVFATSGPRIALQFEQSFAPNKRCELPGKKAVRMGGSILSNPSSVARRKKQSIPTFTVRALKDQAPLQRVDIIKLALVDGEIKQTLRSFAGDKAGRSDWCIAWQDKSYSAQQPALWYARVLETETIRWDGKNRIRERAWSSPIWSLPASTGL